MQWSKYVTITLLTVVFSMQSSYCQNTKQISTVVKLADSTKWVSIDESDWSVFMDAPSYHFDLAKYYLQKGDNERAAAELKRGNTFFIFLKDRLMAVSRAIEKLSEEIAAGKVQSVDKLQITTAIAIKTIDYKYTMIPIDVSELVLFNDSYWYHFDQSKNRFLENDRTGAASEIRKGASYLKFKAYYTGYYDKAEIKATTAELSRLAAKVEAGKVATVQELDAVFQKAIASVN
ncbi:MAG: hypothetical protein JW795_14720 [Chitinivibrionales bacterium]|nr:hypothetical protein [Chitinivibrionales bacterium]